MRDGGQAAARHDEVPMSESSRGTSGKSVYAAADAKRAYSAETRPGGRAPPAESGSSGAIVAAMTAAHQSRVVLPTSAAPKLGCAALCTLYAARKLRSRPASSPSSASPKRAASSRYCAAIDVVGVKSVP